MTVLRLRTVEPVRTPAQVGSVLIGPGFLVLWQFAVNVTECDGRWTAEGHALGSVRMTARFFRGNPTYVDRLQREQFPEQVTSPLYLLVS